MDDFVYFDVQKIIEIHENVLEESGGFPGIKDMSSLETTVEFVKNDFYYPTLIDKVCYIIFNLATSHPFLDANKRTALSVSAFFLNINEPDFCSSYYMEVMEDMVIFLVENLITKYELGLFVDCIISKVEFSEDLKLLLVNCYQKHHEILESFGIDLEDV